MKLKYIRGKIIKGHHDYYYCSLYETLLVSPRYGQDTQNNDLRPS